jgi:hypothetical protein
MPASPQISFGLGSPASIAYSLTFGLRAATVADHQIIRVIGETLRATVLTDGTCLSATLTDTSLRSAGLTDVSILDAD